MKLTAPLNCNGYRGVGAGDPVNSGDFATKNYVDLLLQSEGIDLGGKKHTRSRTAPINPNPGDTWEELDAADNIVIPWFWSGQYWLAIDIDKEDLPLAATSNPITNYFAIANNYNIYLLNFTTSAVVSNANTNLAYWTLTLGKVSTTNAITAINTSNTSGLAANSWRAATNPVNTLVTADNSAVAFSFAAAKILTPAGTVGGAMQITYRLARK